MQDKVSECIDLITNEIKEQKTVVDTFDVTGDIKRGIIQGLEISRQILTDYWEENY